MASVPIRRSAEKSRQKGGAAVLACTVRSLKFTLGTEVVKGYGAYGQWTFGIAWTAWLDSCVLPRLRLVATSSLQD